MKSSKPTQEKPAVSYSVTVRAERPGYAVYVVKCEGEKVTEETKVFGPEILPLAMDRAYDALLLVANKGYGI